MNIAGAGPPTATTIAEGTVYFDFISGKVWVLGPQRWQEQGAVTPPPPLDPPPVDPPPPTPQPAPVIKLKDFLRSEMNLPHHGPLDGVPPGYDWAQVPRLGAGNNRGGNQASTAWAQVYTSGGQSGGTVEIANLTLATLTGGRWTVIQQTKPRGSGENGGGYFIADFAGNATAPGREPRTGPGGTIVGEPVFGYNLHTWGSPRANLPSQFDAICAWFDAHIITAGAATFLAGAGGDYYASLDSNPPQGDFAIGRLRRLTQDWSTHCTHTMTAAQIESGPLPPIILAGAGPVTPAPPVVTPPATGTWKLPVGRPVKVMFCGDSITRMLAEDPMGLATLHSQMPYEIELVGGQVTGSGLRHEGHGAWCASDEGGRCEHTNGYRAGGVLQNIAGWVTANQPDVVVLNIGINDAYVRTPYSPDEVAEAVARTVDAVHTARPWVMVAVALYGRDNLPTNPLVQAQVAARAQLGRPVRFFDPWHGFGGDDYQGQGNVHPSPSGVVKMIAATATALAALASI